MAFALIPQSPEQLGRLVKIITTVTFVCFVSFSLIVDLSQITAIFNAWLYPMMAMAFAVALMGWLGAEMQSYSLLTFVRFLHVFCDIYSIL